MRLVRDHRLLPFLTISPMLGVERRDGRFRSLIGGGMGMAVLQLQWNFGRRRTSLAKETSGLPPKIFAAIPLAFVFRADAVALPQINRATRS